MSDPSSAMEAWLALVRQIYDSAAQADPAATASGPANSPPTLVGALIQRGLNVLSSEQGALADGEDPASVGPRILSRLRAEVDELLALNQSASDAALLPVELASTALRHLAALQAAQPLAGVAGTAPGSTPHLGVLQNHQALLENLGAAATRYREAAARYGQLLAQVGEDSLVEFEARTRPQGAPASLRELHQSWVSAGEAAYERVLRSTAYSEAFGDLTNASVELSGALQRLWDEVLESFNLPSRRELDATQTRIEQVRRRGELESRELRQQIDELRRDLRALRAGLAKPQTAEANSHDQP